MAQGARCQLDHRQVEQDRIAHPQFTWLSTVTWLFASSTKPYRPEALFHSNVAPPSTGSHITIGRLRALFSWDASRIWVEILSGIVVANHITLEDDAFDIK